MDFDEQRCVAVEQMETDMNGVNDDTNHDTLSHFALAKQLVKIKHVAVAQDALHSLDILEKEALSKILTKLIPIYDKEHDKITVEKKVKSGDDIYKSLYSLKARDSGAEKITLNCTDVRFATNIMSQIESKTIGYNLQDPCIKQADDCLKKSELEIKTLPLIVSFARGNLYNHLLTEKKTPNKML